MRATAAAIARLTEEAQERQRVAAGQIVGQLGGGQVAPGSSGSPGVVDPDAFEPALGNPGADGYGLISTAAGVRSWAVLLTDPTTTAGDLIYRGAVSLTRLPVDAAGKFLGVAAGLPAWAAVGWADVAGKPATFPPEAHTQAASTISDLAEAVQDIVGAAIKAGGTNVTVSYNDTTGETTISVSLQTHAASHATGGSDAISPSSIGAVATGSNAADNRVAVWESATTVGGDAGLTWDGTLAKIGSAAAPYSFFKLLLSSSAGNCVAGMYAMSDDGETGGGLILGKARGSESSPAAVQNGDRLGFQIFGARAPSGAWVNPAGIVARVNAAPSGATVPTQIDFEVDDGTGRAPRLRVGGTQVQPLVDVDLASGKVIKINGTQVLGARRTGWTAATGTKARTTFATDSATAAQIAARLGALIDDLIATGAIGS